MSHLNEMIVAASLNKTTVHNKVKNGVECIYYVFPSIIESDKEMEKNYLKTIDRSFHLDKSVFKMKSKFGFDQLSHYSLQAKKISKRKNDFFRLAV